MSKIPGFEPPEQNWSKLPHQFIEYLPIFQSHGELACVIYILRHTWGFSEYDKPKRISLDEFVHGRKDKDGKRMDKGVGVSRSSVQRGLKLAEEHGFITADTDDTDKGRIEKYYHIVMQSVQVEHSLVQDEHSAVQVEQSGCSNPTIVHRKKLKKETKERVVEPIPEPAPAAATTVPIVKEKVVAIQEAGQTPPTPSSAAPLPPTRNRPATKHPVLIEAWRAGYPDDAKPTPKPGDYKLANRAEQDGYTAAQVTALTKEKLATGKTNVWFRFIVEDLADFALRQAKTTKATLRYPAYVAPPVAPPMTQEEMDRIKAEVAAKLANEELSA